MSDNKTISASISENGNSPYAVDIAVSGYNWQGDEPVDFGGGGLGPAPYDTLLAALGECSAMTIRWYALQQKWPLEHVRVDITHRKVARSELDAATQARLPVPGNTGDRPSNVVDIFEKHITITGDALTTEQKQKLYDVSAKCPVQRTLQNGAIVSSI